MVSCSGSLVPSRCREVGVAAFPVYAAQAPGCSRWSGPCVVCGSSFQVLHKSADSVVPVFFAFRAGAAQAARSSTGALSPGAVRLLPSMAPVGCLHPVFSRDPPGRCRPSRISGSLWLETGGLLQFGRGCHLCGRVCPFPLPAASCLWRGWAGPPPASSSLVLLSPFVL